MHSELLEYTQIICNYCRNTLDLNKKLYTDKYKSMSVCIIDCIYSLRARYFSVTVPVVERYAKCFMNNDRFASGDNVREFVSNIDTNGGDESFAKNILLNNQKIGGRLKSTICYDLAKKLLLLGINSIEDFQNFENQELLDVVISSVKGIGDAGKNYLYMLAGDESKCKPDVHIHHFLVDACGRDFSNDECQILFQNVVNELKKDFPKMTVRLLDGIIWDKYQGKRRSK